MAPRAAVWRCSKDKKTLFTVSVVQQVIHRGYGVIILDEVQNLTGHSHGQPALGDPDWPGELDQMISRALFLLKASDSFV